MTAYGAGVTVETLACNRPIELTVAEFLHFDSVVGARHPVPARLHCQLERGHDEAHMAFAQSPGDDDSRTVWWMRWSDKERSPVQRPYCWATDPNWPPDADEHDDMDCQLPELHENAHQWEMSRPTLEFTRGANPVSETGKEHLRKVHIVGVGPQIRIHRYEYIAAIRWPEFDRWLMIWPDELAKKADPDNPYAGAGQRAATTEWRPVTYGDADFDDRHEWIDPAADHSRDFMKLTAMIRETVTKSGRELNHLVGSLLDRIEDHPYHR